MGSLESANIALGALRQSRDKWLEYAIWLTSRELRDDWLPALEAGETVFGGDTDQLRYALEATGDSRATESLISLLQNGNVNATNLPNVVKTVAGLGGVEEIDMVLSLAAKQPTLLTPIVAGARHNKATPKGIKKVLPLLEHQDSDVRRAAAELTGIWRVTDAGESLEKLVRNSENIQERLTAARALGRLKHFDRLAKLANSNQSQKIRIAATAIWAENQPDKARESVIEIFAKASTIQEIEPLFLSFINRQSGDKQLQEALQDISLHESIAIEGIRLIRSSGREFPGLVSALTKAGNLKLVPLDLSQKDRKKLLSKVAISGNPERGKEVYHRKSSACTVCHQIGRGGGLVGPELSSIGAYAQPAAILDSILSPSRDIKQGFETVLVTKQDDTIVAGIFQRRSDTATLIRETTNKIVPIPNSEVKKIEKSPVSLMPPGLTLSLRGDELVDLLSFLVSLDGTTGKTERDE
jgi:putative heme-binding domain-containing protein